MDVSKILKFAFVTSVVIYGVVGVLLAGAPDWGRGLLPEPPASPALLGVFLFLSLATWAAGMVAGRISAPPAGMALGSGGAPWGRTRFILAAALIEAGAIFGLVLSALAKDSRFAIAAAAVSAVLLLVTPASDGAGA